jgi:p-aminobenzoyl-glutamate transporter AbgT
MAQQSNDLRERLLATMPQPENLAAYREKSNTLLAKHARALRWDYFTTNAFYLIAGVLLFLSTPNYWHPDAIMRSSFQFGSALFFFVGMIFDLRYRIYSSRVATLKELKQVQLQILELQASLQKDQ